jgi:hypothetical protein
MPLVATKVQVSSSGPWRGSAAHDGDIPLIPRAVMPWFTALRAYSVKNVSITRVIRRGRLSREVLGHTYLHQLAAESWLASMRSWGSVGGLELHTWGRRW